MSEYLGSAILEVGANLAPLRAGLMEGERLTAASLRRMQAEQSSRLAASGAALGGWGRNMTRTLTMPILGIAAVATKMSVDFDRSMEMIHTQAGASQKEVDLLKEKVLALGKAVPFGPTKLADALYHIESIGLRLNGQFTQGLTVQEKHHLALKKNINALSVLKDAAHGAAVGNADLEHTATALGSAWLVNIKGGRDLHKVMGLLNAVVGVGNMRMEDLVTALGTGLLPMAKNAGLSIQDALAALALFSDEGYRASSAATQMATAFHYLTDPTDKAKKALGEIHVTQMQLVKAMHGPNGLHTALSLIKDQMEKTFPTLKGGLAPDQISVRVEKARVELEKAGVHGDKLKEQLAQYRTALADHGQMIAKQEQIIGDMFPAGRGRVLMVLMNQLDRYDQKLTQVGVNQGKFNEDVKKTMEQPAVRIQQAWASLQSSLVRFGEEVGPPLIDMGTKFLGMIETAFDKFSNLPPGVKKTLETGGLILAAVGPAMRLLSFFMGGVAKLWGIAQIAGRLATGGGLKAAQTSAVASMNVEAMTVANMEVANLIVRGGLPPGAVPGSPGGPRAGGPGPIYGAPPAGPNAGRTRLPTWLGGTGLRNATDEHLAGRALPGNAPTVVQDPTTGRYRALTPAERAAVIRSYTPATVPEHIAGGGVRAYQGALKYGGRALAGAGTAGMILMGGQILSQVTGNKTVGTIGNYAAGGAMAGSMFGPEGMVVGAIGGALVGGLKGLFHSPSFGENLAASFGKGDFIGKAISKSQEAAQKEAAKTDKEAGKLTDEARKADHSDLDPRVYGSGHGLGQHALNPTTPAERARAAAIYMQAGAKASAGIGTELSTYKHIDPASISAAFINKFSGKDVNDQMRQGGATALLSWAKGMEDKGRLPRHAVDQIFGMVEAAFPGLKRKFTEAGISGATALAYGLKRDDAVKANQTVIDRLSADWSGMPKLLDNTGANMVKNMATQMGFLEATVTSSTGKTKRDALKDLKDLKEGADKQFTAMGHQTDASMKSMTDSIRSNTGNARQSATKNMGDLADSVTAAMQSGVIATSTGMDLIGNALNTLLTAFGVKKVPLTSLTNKQIKSLTSEVSSGAITPGQASTAGNLLPYPHHEQGGLVQFGDPGTRGRDNIPVNFGGVPVVVGSGEIGAVFTNEQQRVADAYLAPVGGLGGLFSNYNTPHWATSPYERGGRIPFAHGGRIPFGRGGFSQGSGRAPGRIGEAGLEGLWAQAGGPRPLAWIAAQIALAESDGWPWRNYGDPPPGGGLHTGDDGAHKAAGLWQILGRPAGHFGSAYDPLENAKMAVAKWRQQGLRAWVGDTAYEKYVPGHYATGPGQVSAGMPYHGAPFSASSAAAGGGGSIPTIPTPKVKGGGTIGTLVNAALKLGSKAANAFVMKSAGAAAGAGGAIGIDPGGPGGVSTVQGIPVATWIAEILKRAQADGVPIQVSSGFRSYAEQVYLWNKLGHDPAIVARPGTSNHEGSKYPKGAVDLSAGSWGPMAAWLARHPSVPLHHYSEPRDPFHFSASGHERGGFVGVPRFARGGLVGRRAKPVFAQTGLSPVAHAARRVTHNPYPTPTASHTRLPTSGGKSSSSSSSGKAKVTTGKHKTPRAPHALPRLSSPKGFDTKDVSEIGRLDTLVEELGSWESFIQSYHQRVPVTTTLRTPDTDTADGVDYLNWGRPGAGGAGGVDILGAIAAGGINMLSGDKDPDTGRTTKAIWDRVREIGLPTDRLPIPNTGTKAPADINATELGLEETILDMLLREQSLAGTTWGEFQPWLKQTKTHQEKLTAVQKYMDLALDPTVKLRGLPKVNLDILNQDTGFVGRHGHDPKLQDPFGKPAKIPPSTSQQIRKKVQEYKNAIARLLRNRLRAGFLTTERRHALENLADRYTSLRHRLSRGEKMSAGSIHSSLSSGLAESERSELSGVPTRAPDSWQGDAQSWKEQRTLEVNAIRSHYESRRSTIADLAASARLNEALKEDKAREQLTLHERQERSAIEDDFGRRNTLHRNEIIRLQGTRDADHSWLRRVNTDVDKQATYVGQQIKSAESEGGIQERIKSYLDPMGTLGVNIKTKQLIDIPNLLDELNSLAGSHLTASSRTSTADQGNSALTGLLEQQVAMLGEQLAISQAQYKVLSNLPNMPYGGSFDTGGIVPGPLGAARMILAHGGETVLPTHKQSMQPVVHVIVQDGAVREDKIKVIANGEAMKVTRQAARVAGLGLPSTGGGGVL